MAQARLKLPVLVAMMLALTLLAAGAMAHSDKKELSGKVLLIKADSLVVELKNGKTREIRLTPDTRYLKDKQPAKLGDMAIGDHVELRTESKGLDLFAEEVNFSTPPAPKAPKE